MVWLAVVVSIAAFALMLHLIRTQDATRVSALQYFVPPVTMGIAYVVFGEKLNLLGFIGLAITSVGFYVMLRAEARRNIARHLT